MNIYKLEKKDFINYSKKFKKTFIGRRLYSTFICMVVLFYFYLFFGVLSKSGLNISTDLIISTFLCLTLISYYVYFKYLKEYIEKDKKQE